jgi:hypothetical protein
MGWVVAYPIVALPLYWKTFATIRMETGEYLSALRPAIDGSLFMTAGVLLLRWRMPSAVPLAGRLVMEIVVGGITYVGIEFLFHRPRILAFMQLSRSFRSRRSNP